MNINNTPALNLITTVLGEKNLNQTRPIEPVDEKNQPAAQQVARPVTEAEKQSAQQQLDSRNSEQRQQNLFRDQPNSSYTQKALNSYVTNDEAEQNRYISDVLGIDVRA